MALGLVDLDATGDLEETRRVLRRTANILGFAIVDVMTFRRTDTRWAFRLVEMVHRFAAHAVIVADTTHVGEFVDAITGVADLHSRTVSHAYVGHGPEFTRPSAASGCR